MAVYRVPSPTAGTILLNYFNSPGSISHAVLGGHGSDNAWRLGLALSVAFFGGDLPDGDPKREIVKSKAKK